MSQWFVEIMISNDLFIHFSNYKKEDILSIIVNIYIYKKSQAEQMWVKMPILVKSMYN